MNCKCGTEMELISQNISNDVLANKARIWTMYKCHGCGKIHVERTDKEVYIVAI